MLYAKIENDSVAKYPYSMSDLRKDNPSTSFPINSLENEVTRTERGVVEVAESSQPTAKSGHKIVEGTPALVGGVWTQVWDEVLKAPHEVLESELVKTAKPEKDWHWAESNPPEWDGSVWNQTWHLEPIDWYGARIKSYGEPYDQIEYITENGLEAWQTKVAEIKAKYPKS